MKEIKNISFSRTNWIKVFEGENRLIVTNKDEPSSKIWDSKTGMLNKLPYEINVLNAVEGLFVKRYYLGDEELSFGTIDQLDLPLTKFKACPSGKLSSVASNYFGTQIGIICSFTDYGNESKIHLYEVK